MSLLPPLHIRDCSNTRAYLLADANGLRCKFAGGAPGGNWVQTGAKVFTTCTGDNVMHVTAASLGEDQQYEVQGVLEFYTKFDASDATLKPQLMCWVPLLGLWARCTNEDCLEVHVHNFIYLFA